MPLGENEISLSLEECELFTQNSFQIFACVNFGRYKPVATNVVAGLMPNLKFRYENLTRNSFVIFPARVNFIVDTAIKSTFPTISFNSSKTVASLSS